MLAFRSWAKWQGKGLADVKRMRETRGTDASRPYAMGYIIVGTTLDDDFRAFASIVGGKVAESYLLRSMQYAGLHSAFVGEIHVARDKFGPLVLSREWDIVSVKTGRVVYDALIASSIACPIGTRSEQVANASRSLSSLSVQSIPPVVLPSAGGDPEPLNATDAAVLDAILRRCRTTSIGTLEQRTRGMKLAEDRRMKALNPDDARRLIDELQAASPEMLSESQNIRRTYAMGEKARASA